MPHPAAIHSTPGLTPRSSTPRGSLLARVVSPVTACIREIGAGRDGGAHPPGAGSARVVPVRRIGVDRPPVPPD
jgi:hypothetical protein